MEHAEVLLVQDGRYVQLGTVGPGRCTLSTVDHLARLQLVARRFGWSIRVRHATPELVELLVLAGLADTIPHTPRPCGPTSRDTR